MPRGYHLGPNFAKALPDLDAVAMDVGGQWVLVDAADYPRIKDKRWYWIGDKVATTGERNRKGKYPQLYLTKVLLDPPDRVQVRKINMAFPGDYRRANLRIVRSDGIARPKR